MSEKEGNDNVSDTKSNENFEVPLTSESVEYDNNQNTLFSYVQKACGTFGNSPDLISEETPPIAVLDFASHSDLLIFATTARIEGEETLMVVPPLTSCSSDSSPIAATEPISAENDTSSSQQDTTGVLIELNEEKGECTSQPVCPASASMFPLSSSSSSADNKVTQPLIFSSHQTETTTLDENLKFTSPIFIEGEEEGKGNAIQTNSLTLASPIDTHTESTDTTTMAHVQESEEQISKHVIKTDEDEVPSIANGETVQSNSIHDSVESGAVTAPEAENQTEEYEFVEEEESFCSAMNMNTIQPSSLSSPVSEISRCRSSSSGATSTFPADNIAKSKNIEDEDSNDGTSEPLSKQHQQQSRRKNGSRGSRNWDTTTASSSKSPCPLLDETTNTRKMNSSAASSSREKNLSSANRGSKKEKNSSPSPSSRTKRKQTSSGASRNASKSPIRVVEVFERSGPIQLKSIDPKKPLSPYQCKIVPIEQVDHGPSSKLIVNKKQRQILDDELSRSLEQEQFKLVEALTDYYNNKEEIHPGSASFYSDVIDDDESVLSNDTQQRETYMSWIVREKSKEKIISEDENSGACWNPMANIFRKSRSTQVSNRPSFSHETNTSSVDNMSSQKSIITQSNRIRLVGQGKESDISDAGQRMYQSLKSLQKAIHLSDLFCFRNNAPDLPLGESLSQPMFQQFMESENEIEIVGNIMTLLGNAKDHVNVYLKSLRNANLVTDAGLSKIENTKGKELNNIEIEDAKETNQEADSTEENQIVLFTCPSCQSKMDLEISTPRPESPRDRILPKVYTFFGEQTKVTLSTYYTRDSNSLVQTVVSDGHRYQTHFHATDPSGPVQGILKTDKEYIGEPSHLSVEILLSTIHRCASYIDTRIACSCVWTRQSKRYLLQLIESYLEKEYKPSSDMGRWKVYRMERKLKKINVFAGIIRHFSEELVDAVNKLHFCMQKSTVLLNKKLREPGMPGFAMDFTSSSWEDMNTDFNSTSDCFAQKSFQTCYDVYMGSSVENLYEKLKATEGNDPESGISVQILMQIVARAAKDIDMACSLGQHYTRAVKMPGKNGRRVLRFMNITMSQLGFSKDIHFASLLATFLSVVDKLSLFEQFMCEQKVEVRAKVHKMCLKIVRKLYDLRANLCMQLNWSINLAKNSYMRIKELNEIKRFKKLKRSDKNINEKIEFIRGSDGSLQASVCK